MWLKAMPLSVKGEVYYCHPSCVAKGPCRSLIQKTSQIIICCVRVIHCHDAWGCVITIPMNKSSKKQSRKYDSPLVASRLPLRLTQWEQHVHGMFNDAMKIVYSGDTIPSPNLIKEGFQCNLLIHEATYAADKEKMAGERRHTTVNQVRRTKLKVLFFTLPSF